MYKQARARIEIGAYNLQGRGEAVPLGYRGKFFDAGTRRYYIGARFRQGDECVLYNGYLEVAGSVWGEVVLKVASSAENSPFVEREANALAIMRKENYRETSYLPWPIDRFESGGRMGMVMRRLDGFNLEEVRDYLPHRDGVNPRDMVWMLSRTLAVTGLAHRYGVVHGRICPKHVLIEVPSHVGMVVGWGGCAVAPARSGQKVLAPIETYSAPEASGATGGPWSDIYSIGRTFIWLLGGDPVTGTLPDHVEPKLRTFLRNMTNADPYQRPDDCWKLFEELDRLKVELWGPKKWRVFDMPAPSVLG
jgi:hypothetical protein